MRLITKKRWFLIWYSVDHASWYICVIRINRMHFFLSIYFSNHHLYVLNRLTIHHPKVVYCRYSIYHAQVQSWLVVIWNFILHIYGLFNFNTDFFSSINITRYMYHYGKKFHLRQNQSNSWVPSLFLELSLALDPLLLLSFHLLYQPPYFH